MWVKLIVCWMILYFVYLIVFCYVCVKILCNKCLFLVKGLVFLEC